MTEWPFARVVLATILCQGLTLACLTCHIILVSEVGLACAPILFVGLAMVAASNSLIGLMVYLQILLYQNVLISVFSPGFSRLDYTVSSGSAFAAAAVLAVQAFLRMRNRQRPSGCANAGISHPTWWAVIAIAVAAAYTALGLSEAGTAPASVGFRNATAMLFAIIIGLDVGDRWAYRTVALAFVVSSLLGLLLVGIEIADPAWYLAAINASEFSNVKLAMAPTALVYTAEGLMRSNSSLTFNTDLLSMLGAGTAYRFGGPNMHPISYAYVLGVLELTLISLGWFAAVAPLLVLSFLIGVKGAAIMFAGGASLYAFWHLTRSKLALGVCGGALMAAYVLYGVSSGLAAGDFHAIGFMGGVNGFLANPLGHGLGVGGNLSLGTLSVERWQEFQHNGANVGLESAVGVLLYQMGVGVIAIAVALWTLFRAAPFGAFVPAGRRSQPTDILFIGLCIGLVNGVFQEEAYSPYATGLLCLLCAVLVSNGRRAAVRPRSSGQ